MEIILTAFESEMIAFIIHVPMATIDMKSVTVTNSSVMARLKKVKNTQNYDTPKRRMKK